MSKSIFKIGTLFAFFLIPFINQTQKAAKSERFSYNLNTNAVLVIGTHLSSGFATSEMNKIGDFLKSKGVLVKKFYKDQSNWEDIKKAASNAHFFIYSGHGSNMGKNGTGGLVLEDWITNDQIENELKLRDNALVLFQSVCRGAGSSAGDDGDIGIKVAEQRVSDYAEPFLKIGASMYYANNWGEGCLDFLKDFFRGISVGECYRNSTSSWIKIELDKTYDYNSTCKISIASSEGSGTVTQTRIRNGVKTVKEVPASKDYNIAYVGDPSFTILELTKYKSMASKN